MICTIYWIWENNRDDIITPVVHISGIPKKEKRQRFRWNSNIVSKESQRRRTYLLDFTFFKNPRHLTNYKQY